MSELQNITREFCMECGAVRQGNAAQCECGCDFNAAPARKVFTAKTTFGPSRGYLAIGWMTAFLGGLVGLLLSYTIAYGKNDTGDGPRFSAEYRVVGKRMFVTSIVMSVFWLLFFVARKLGLF